MSTLTELGAFEKMERPFYFRASKELIYELDALSKQTGTNKSELIRRGVKEVINNYNATAIK